MKLVPQAAAPAVGAVGKAVSPADIAPALAPDVEDALDH